MVGLAALLAISFVQPRFCFIVLRRVSCRSGLPNFSFNYHVDHSSDASGHQSKACAVPSLGVCGGTGMGRQKIYFWKRRFETFIAVVYVSTTLYGTDSLPSRPVDPIFSHGGETGRVVRLHGGQIRTNDGGSALFASRCLPSHTQVIIS